MLEKFQLKNYGHSKVIEGGYVGVLPGMLRGLRTYISEWGSGNQKSYGNIKKSPNEKLIILKLTPRIKD